MIDTWTDIGDGCSIAFYSADDEPVDGLLWRHDCPDDPRGPGHGGDAIPFGPPFDGEHWRVAQWVPLTVEGSLLCRACGRHGWIRGGAWVSA